MTTLNKENLSPAAFIGVRGKDIISFGSGEPDLPPPEEVYKILPHYTDFKYGVIQGLDYLRDALTANIPILLLIVLSLQMVPQRHWT